MVKNTKMRISWRLGNTFHGAGRSLCGIRRGLVARRETLIMNCFNYLLCAPLLSRIDRARKSIPFFLLYLYQGALMSKSTSKQRDLILILASSQFSDDGGALLVRIQ